MKRFVVASCILAATILALLIAALRSGWVTESIRTRVIAEIERDTGTKAKLDSISFSWSDLTATLHGLTLRGAEPESGPPLFRAPEIGVGLRVNSLLEGAVRFSMLRIEAPSIYLVQRPDGSLNLPAMQPGVRTNLSDLVRLRTRSIEVERGTLRVNDFQVPIAFSARDLDFEARYRAREYKLILGLNQVSFSLGNNARVAASVHLAGNLSQFQFTVRNFTAAVGNSSFSATGALHNFALPSLDLQVSAVVNASDVGDLLSLPWLKGGQVRINGPLHYDPSAKLSFNGIANASSIVYDRKGVRVDVSRIACHVLATQGLVDLSELETQLLGGKAFGELRFVNLQELSFRGAVSGVDARSVMRLLIPKPLPSTAAATGPLSIDSRITARGLIDALLTADLQLASPVGPNGHLGLKYEEESNRVEFAPSELTFPRTSLVFSGDLNSSLKLQAKTTSLLEFEPTLNWLGIALPNGLALAGPQSQLSFEGEIDSAVGNPTARGNLQASDFVFSGRHWSSALAQFTASESHVQLQNLAVTSTADRVQLDGSAALENWNFTNSSRISLNGSWRTADLSSLAASFGAKQAIFSGGAGTVSGSISGSMDEPLGSAHVNLHDVRAFEQHLTRVHAALALSGTHVLLKAGDVQSGAATLTLQADYQHGVGSWTQGRLHVRADSNRFPLQTVQLLRNHLDGLAAQAEIHADGDWQVQREHFEPLAVNGTLSLRDITGGALRRGDLTFDAGTQGDRLTMGLAGTLEGGPVLGNLRAHLTGDVPATGDLHFGKLSLASVLAIAGSDTPNPGLQGSFTGEWHFSGPLLNRASITSELTITGVELHPASHTIGGILAPEFTLTNDGAVRIETTGPVASIKHLVLRTRDTQLALAGSVNLASNELDLRANGSVDLRVAELFSPGIQTSGTATVSAAVAGLRDRPQIRGTLSIANASLILPDLTNSFTAISGTVRFDRTRATIENLQGATGGGTVRLTGVVTLPGNQPLSYNIDAEGDQVRFRYLRASITGDAKLRMTGTVQSGLVSGDVTVSRVVLEPGADVAALFANAAVPAPAPANQEELLTGLGWDVHIQSSPDLQIATSLSQDVQATVDLHLRGTRLHPILLGQISANQGEVNVFGTRYTISRGNISFTNPVRIDPVLDVDLQTETRGISVDVIITGTTNKLSMNYRSDPPLQAKEILALLTVGQTPTFAPESSNSRIQADTSALQAGATTVLGQAISPASNRLSRFFGVTNVKIDPFIQNEYNNRQARLTLQEQISRSITVTYVTNLAQTSEQIFRFEWSFSPQYSLVAVRDDNGEFGIDIQYKKRFK